MASVHLDLVDDRAGAEEDISAQMKQLRHQAELLQREKREMEQ